MSIVRKFVRWNRGISERLLEKYPNTFAGRDYVYELLLDINHSIESDKPTTILEAGGVDRPMLGKGRGYQFFGVDIEERVGCYQLYDRFFVQSIEDALPVKVDMIVSTTLLEHVPDNTSSVTSIFDSLNPGGATHHYIPSKFHPYSILLRLIGPKMQKRLISILRPGTEEITGYPAFFDHCSAMGMGLLFQKCGFTEISVRPYYRANDYFAFFVPVFILVTLFENLCRALDWRVFASGFVINARRPVEARTAAAGKS